MAAAERYGFRMTVELIRIPGQRDQTIRANLTRSSGRELAILLPGIRYRNSMPVMYYAGKLMFERGADLLAVDYAYDRIAAFEVAPVDEQFEWVRSDGKAVLSAAIALGPYDGVTLIGKSLGTVAMTGALSAAAPLAAKLIWLTPTPGVFQTIADCSLRSLVVIGTADPGHAGFASTKTWPKHVTITLVEGADHGLERPGDVTGSVGALGETIAAMAAWLDSNP